MPTSNYNLEEAGMAQMDDSIGAILKHLEDIGETDNTIVIFTTDNGAEVFTWPDGGMTPFKATKGTVFEGGFRVPALSVGRDTSSRARSRMASSPDSTGSRHSWLRPAIPTSPNSCSKVSNSATAPTRITSMVTIRWTLLEGKGPSARHEIFYFGGPQLGAVRIDDFKFQFFQQPWGWPGEKVTTDMPTIVNLRQDPFERTPSIRGQSLNEMGGGYMNDFMRANSGALSSCNKTVGKLAKTAIDFPPMQKPATFNLDAIKAKIQEAIKAHEGQ